MIFQDLSLFPNLSVLENIAIDCELRLPLLPPPRRAMRDAATAAFARLNAQRPLDAKVGTLPVAQRQIVAICRGLAANARILFMGEPTASLTRREVELLLETVRRLKALGVSRAQTFRRATRLMGAGPPRFAEPRRRGSNQLDRLIATLRERPTGIAGLFALLALLLAVFSVFMPATFPHVTTLQAMMFQLPELGLLSLAIAIPLISGGVNLAINSWRRGPAAQRGELRYSAGGRLLSLTSLVRELGETAHRLIDDQMRAPLPFDAL